MNSLVSSHRQGLRPSEDLPAAFDEMEGRSETNKHTYRSQASKPQLLKPALPVLTH